MTKFKLWAICFACFTLPALAQNANQSAVLIPAPQKITKTSQQFVLDAQTRIAYGTDENLPIAKMLQSYISGTYGFTLNLVAKAEGKRITLLENTDALYKPESYILHIDEKQVELKGKGAMP